MPAGRRVRPGDVLETDSADGRRFLDQKDCVHALAPPSRDAIPAPLGHVVFLVPLQGSGALVDELMQPRRARLVDDHVGAVCETGIGFWSPRLHPFGVTAAVDPAIVWAAGEIVELADGARNQGGSLSAGEQRHEETRRASASRCAEAGASNLSRYAEVGGLLELSFDFCDRDTLDPAVLDDPEQKPLRGVLNGLRQVLLVDLRRPATA